MFGWIDNVPPVLEFVILLGAFITAVGIIYKWVYKPIRRFSDKVNSGMDTLLGYPAVMDPGSGKELKPPTPALALRVDALEDAMHRLLDLQEKQVGLNERILELEQWRKGHTEWSEDVIRKMNEDNIAWQREHETLHAISHTTATEVASEMKKTD